MEPEARTPSPTQHLIGSAICSIPALLGMALILAIVVANGLTALLIWWEEDPSIWGVMMVPGILSMMALSLVMPVLTAVGIVAHPIGLWLATKAVQYGATRAGGLLFLVHAGALLSTLASMFLMCAGMFASL